MYYPNKEEFIKLSERGNLIPVYREITSDFESPLSAFSKIDNGEFSYLLESIEGGELVGRYSFLGSNPSLVLTTKGKTATITEGKAKKTYEMRRDPLTEIKNIMKRFSFVPVDGLPRFSGGLVGYMGYDAVRFFEELPDKNKDDLNLDDCVFVLTDTMLIFDHIERKIKIVSNAFVRNDAAFAYDRAVQKIENIIKQLSTVQGFSKVIPKKKPSRGGKLRISSNFTKSQFMRNVLKAKKYIKKGDIIQVVLSQRLKTNIKCEPFEIYKSLRSINPSPYMFYLKFGKTKLIGSSPEIMVRCEDGKVELRPIAGTRKRGRDNREDRNLAKGLLKDPKERAEHIMLVDLGRNDIGRVCRYDTVKVQEFMLVEKYSHVMHIVSDVTGQLKPECDIFDLARATFPAGTVTGAPKIRAMEIIDELENVKRATYAGSVGYFSFSGNLDTGITIRTILVKGNTAYVQAGAGIVADSKPAMEYKETFNKARAMLKAIEQAERGL